MEYLFVPLATSLILLGFIIVHTAYPVESLRNTIAYAITKRYIADT